MTSGPRSEAGCSCAMPKQVSPERNPHSPGGCGHRRSALLAAVLDLPGVVEGVPGESARCVARVPAVGLQRSALRGPAQGFEEGLTVGLVEAEADLSRVSEFGPLDVLADLVPVPTAAPRALPKLGRGLGHDLVERLPG